MVYSPQFIRKKSETIEIGSDGKKIVQNQLVDKNGIEFGCFGHNGVSVNAVVEDEGHMSAKGVFTISGRVKLGKTRKIANLKISAENQNVGDSVYGFRKSPKLTRKSINDSTAKIKTVLNNQTIESQSTIRRTVKDSIAYDYDIFINPKDVGIRKNTLSYKLDAEMELRFYKWKEGLTNILWGNDYVDGEGESRRIVIEGAPGSTAALLIQELTDVKDANDVIISTSETSIIPKNLKDKTGEWSDPKGTGTKHLGFKYLIPKSGRYTFVQTFPKSTSEKRYVIRLNSSGVSKKFADILINQKDWQYGVDGWSNWYSYYLTQAPHPSLTLKTKTTWSNATVDSNQNGTFVTFDASNPINKIYKGKYNKESSKIKYSKRKNYFKIIDVFKASSGGFALRAGSDGAGGTLGAPVFSKQHGSESDWTNSIPTANSQLGETGNGGTEVEISDISVAISTTSSSNDTLTLKYTLNILKWGTKDVTMELDTDKIATLS